MIAVANEEAAMITESIEIARPPEEVFAYLDDLARHKEWQTQIVSSRVETEGPTRVGTRVSETRLMGKREQSATYEITEHDPPRRMAFRTLDGPIRPFGAEIVEPIDGGSRTRFTFELDFEAHGPGKMLLPLARSQARKQVPKDQQALKERLESGAA
jgi:uncharacterized protein YndB with AHSA1/START domain